MTRLALLLLAAAPLAAAADGAPADPPRAAGPAVTLGGDFAWTGFATFGGLDANDLPRAAVPPPTERTFGMTVRQSRLRAAVALPADGLLGRARLDGLAELDLMGGLASGDQSFPVVRLRHAWVQASWEELAHLQVLVGQAWGLAGGPNLPLSVAHLAVPRFAGAGVLYRRAPQLRATAAWGGDLSLRVEGALLAPIDRARSPAATGASPDRPPPTGVGERSGLPDAEGRVSLRLQPGGRRLLEVGLSGHAGRETFLLAGAAGDVNASLDAWGGALDARLDLPHLVVLAGGYAGKNLDVLSTLAPGVTLSLGANGAPIAATGVAVHGGFAQVQLSPWAGLTLLAGAGLEAASRADLPANPPPATVPLRNLQVSGGALLDLASRWQAGVEYTTYYSRYLGPGDRDLTSGQLEVATRVTF